MAKDCENRITAGAFVLVCLAGVDYGVAYALVRLLGLCDGASKIDTLPKCIELDVAATVKNPPYVDKYGSWCNYFKTKRPGTFVPAVDLDKWLRFVVKKVGNLTACPDEHAKSVVEMGESGKCADGTVTTRFFKSDQYVTMHDECLIDETMKMWMYVGFGSLFLMIFGIPAAYYCWDQCKRQPREGSLAGQDNGSSHDYGALESDGAGATIGPDNNRPPDYEEGSLSGIGNTKG